MNVEIWAPPNLSKNCIRDKVKEWMRLHPNTPPYQRFLQDYISSQWPILWHLKTKFILSLDSEIESENAVEEDICSICHCHLNLGIETLDCGHAFHTMCIHRWLQRANTCPNCRAEL